jgi:hypothetical protein
MMRSPRTELSLTSKLVYNNSRTNLCVTLHLHDIHAFDNRSTRIVDAIQHRL